MSQRLPKAHPKTSSVLDRVHLVPLKKRKSKVQLKLLGEPPQKNISFENFWKGLPEILAVSQLKLLIQKIVEARKKGKPVLMMFGAHVIKVGLSRYLISLLEKGWVTAFATNGAGAIHDFELSFGGATSEDVALHLKKGIFGFAKETGEHLNNWAIKAAQSGRGLGETIGSEISRSSFPNKSLSLFAKAYEAGVPVTVHAGIGTDIIYQHPSCSGAAWGESSFTDFRCLIHTVGNLGDGGVAMNWGSAVILPEVFLKTIAVNKNLGVKFHRLTTANFDMIGQYRAFVNVLKRPTQEEGGLALHFTGHHEIMLPLLAQGLMTCG